ncbi:MAG: hypothetical protein M3320_09725 [Actinomycetota bacterium]|nr:hypothetical protein [Actinomycetota bacterium]
MNIRRRVGIELLILSVIAAATGLIIRFAELPIWIGIAVAAGGSGLIVHDMFRTDAGRPLWRWKWLDEGGPRRPPEPG